MKLCKCGGRLRRHSKDYIKSTGETKIRLRCEACKVFESHYFDEPPVFRKRRNEIGPPSYVELR